MHREEISDNLPIRLQRRGQSTLEDEAGLNHIKTLTFVLEYLYKKFH